MNVRERNWGYRPPRKPKGCRKAPEPVQLSLAHAPVAGRGGPRANSGRKKGPRPKVRHRVRGAHCWYQPVHVTLRRAKGVPGLRAERLERIVRNAIRDSHSDTFRVVHYSIQADHVHLIVEADDAASLSKGMRSFAIRVALRINRAIFNRRKGRVWADRYHRHDLTNPTSVRNVLVYVLDNHLKHGEHDVGLIDPCSSAPGFEGWMQIVPPPPYPRAVAPPRTWLLREGWTTVGHGLLHVGEVPRALRH
jgi:REP element-mobilizing transposase RayT